MLSMHVTPLASYPEPSCCVVCFVPILLLLLSPRLQTHMANLPTASSCRAGAVVYMQSASNVKVPVTIQLSTHDESDHVKHVVKVRCCSCLSTMTDASFLSERHDTSVVLLLEKCCDHGSGSGTFS